MSGLFPPPPSKIEDGDTGDFFRFDTLFHCNDHCCSTLASMNYQQNDQYVENDTPNESNDGMHVIGENNLLINKVLEEDDFHGPVQENGFHRPVLPFDSGEGLPYAPVDWPSPGDIWTWRVGRRFHLSTGYFKDRFLRAPKRLQMLGRGSLSFGSKIAVENYIRSAFPDADVGAFFASFVWKIRAKIVSLTKEVASFNLEFPPPNEVVEEKEEKEEFHKSGRKNRKVARMQLKQDTIASLSEQNLDASPSISKRKNRMPKWNGAFSPSKKNPLVSPATSTQKSISEQNLDASLSISKRKTRMPKRNGAFSPSKKNPLVSPSTSTQKSSYTFNQHKPFTANNEAHFQLPEQRMINVIPEDFDNYLNSLEDFLTQPLYEPPMFYYAANTNFSAAEDDLAEARRKLSSLLVMDFPSLVLSKNIPGLVALSTKLRKEDPHLNAEQLVKLKLIEEIPSFSEVFLESRETINEVNKSKAALEAKKANAISLKNEYSELKEKADQLQTHVDSYLLAVHEIDKQITQLQSWRAELTKTIDTNKAAKFEVTSVQSSVANEIPTIVHEILRSNSKAQEWKLKKTNAEKREAEILGKFAPLKGFSL